MFSHKATKLVFLDVSISQLLSVFIVFLATIKKSTKNSFRVNNWWKTKKSCFLFFVGI